MDIRTIYICIVHMYLFFNIRV